MVATEYQNRSQRDPKAFKSSVYPPGTEFALCIAQAQIMSAVVAVLNESITESIKGFYRIRKAYMFLKSIAEIEEKYMQEHEADTNLAKDANRPTSETYQNDEGKTAPRNSIGSGHADGFSHASAEGSSKTQKTSTAGHHDPMTPYVQNPIDAYIHSTSALNHGLLSLMISLIPPAFSRLLYIIGFYGDRDRGLDLLWRASNNSNINGAIAGLVLLGYYNGLVAFLEIRIPGRYPEARLQMLLKRMRERYPDSLLWFMEEARMHSAQKQLERAVQMLHDGMNWSLSSGPDSGISVSKDAGDRPNSKPTDEDMAKSDQQQKKHNPSTLKQVEALRWFEHALDSMYLHNYAACSDSFIRCKELNNWNHALYYYMAGICHVELYRVYKYGGTLISFHSSDNATYPMAASTPRHPDCRLAEEHAKKAESLLDKVPALAGKKRFLTRQLPYDIFILRKVRKWSDRAKARDCRLIDAIGVSPLEEMIYSWGGHQRMRRDMLEESLRRLDWSGDQLAHDEVRVSTGESGRDPHWQTETFDEKAIVALLRAAVLKSLHRTEEARNVLRTEIVDDHAWAEFRGGNKDNWTAPLARYELAACLWQEARLQDGGEYDREKLKQCKGLLEQVANWESYDLDVRFGIKITTGLETLRNLGMDLGW